LAILSAEYVFPEPLGPSIANLSFNCFRSAFLKKLSIFI